MRRKIIVLTALVTLTLWLGSAFGCKSLTASLNEANLTYHAGVLPELTPQEPMEFSGESSLQGVDRSHWAATQVRISRHDTLTRPVYWKSRSWHPNPPARASGEYPTIDSVLWLADDTATTKAQYIEMAFDPVHQVINWGVVPIRLFRTPPPGTRERGPLMEYELAAPALADAPLLASPTTDDSTP